MESEPRVRQVPRERGAAIVLLSATDGGPVFV
mgnify:CR=1 FL=1